VRNGSQTGKDEITVPETGVVVVGGEVLQAKKNLFCYKGELYLLDRKPLMGDP
jgi:hypothetical protein